MQRTLKREFKELEVVGKEAIVVAVETKDLKGLVTPSYLERGR
jgi:hypothetical protein